MDRTAPSEGADAGSIPAGSTMTVQTMRLHRRPFEAIASGSKTIEIRLNDEKRQRLSIGDEIEFISRENPERMIRVKITRLTPFPTFKELCYAYPPHTYGSTDPAEYRKMYEHYSPEDEKRYGVLAIEFSLM